MAINSVSVVQPTQRTAGSKDRQGGGKMGQMLGLAAAGATIAATGGMAAPAAVGLLAGGSSLGGTVGEMVSPSKQGTSAMERRLEAPGPQIIESDQSKQLKQSLISLRQAPPDVIEQYRTPLVQAYVTSLAKDNPKAGGYTA